jgi:hypothetical protein
MPPEVDGGEGMGKWRRRRRRRINDETKFEYY